MRLRILATAFLLPFIASIARADGLIVPIRPDLRVRNAWAVKSQKNFLL